VVKDDSRPRRPGGGRGEERRVEGECGREQLPISKCLHGALHGESMSTMTPHYTPLVTTIHSKHDVVYSTMLY